MFRGQKVRANGKFEQQGMGANHDRICAIDQYSNLQPLSANIQVQIGECRESPRHVSTLVRGNAILRSRFANGTVYSSEYACLFQLMCACYIRGILPSV